MLPSEFPNKIDSNCCLHAFGIRVAQHDDGALILN